VFILIILGLLNQIFFVYTIVFWVVRILFDFSWIGLFLIYQNTTWIILAYIRCLIFFFILIIEKNKVIVFASYFLVLFRIIFFFSSNFLILYVFFELTLFPILLIILGYGSQIEKINSSYYLVFYTFFCSLPFFFFYYNLFFIMINFFDLFVTWEMILILVLIFIVKFPLYFFHLWLPKAHVEAPTTARILLAGLLLKLGTGGFIRFIGLLNFFCLNLFFFLSFFGLFLGVINCYFQSDSKSLAAYSSIIHIRLVFLGLLFLIIKSKLGGLILIFSHGITSSLIFYFIGEFYTSRGNRLVYFFNGLIFFYRFFLMFILTFLSNIGVPFFLSFFSELIVVILSFFSFIFFFFVLFFYFFFRFYRSLFFIINSIIGKLIIFFKEMNVFFSYFIILFMFNLIFFLFIF
jgi:NADH:ubiquinone oxidoreductase subunit 4 (subunit M)